MSRLGSTGMSGFAEATERPKPSLPDQMRWAEKTLPDECASFVVAAAWVIAYRGETPTAENVRAELVAEGKTKAQLNG